MEKIESRPNIKLLVAGMHREMQNLVTEGVSLVWESYKLDPYVQRLAEMVVLFQEKVDDLLVVDEEIDIDVRSLESCAYATNSFEEIIEKIQKAVDTLSLGQVIDSCLVLSLQTLDSFTSLPVLQPSCLGCQT